MILENGIRTPQSFVEALTGRCYIFNNDDVIEEIHERLRENGIESEDEPLWDYPLDEAKHIEENNIPVILVDVTYIDEENVLQPEHRWFEVPRSMVDDFVSTNKEPVPVYEIQLTCWDFRKPEPYTDKVNSVFYSKDAAMAALLACAIDEADNLNFGDAEEDGATPVGSRPYFRIDLDADHDAIIRAWDGDDYSNVTAYNIICASDDVKACNDALKEKHGPVKVEIRYLIDDNDTVQYFWTSQRQGDSDGYLTAVEAYKHADEYLTNIDLFVD